MSRMTIKIKAPRAWSSEAQKAACQSQVVPGQIPVRIVRESDWRKLMKLVRAVEEHERSTEDNTTIYEIGRAHV